MIILKSCPKCITGAIYTHEGLDGIEHKCVNCAYVVPSINPDVIAELARERAAELEAIA